MSSQQQHAPSSSYPPQQPSGGGGGRGRGGAGRGGGGGGPHHNSHYGTPPPGAGGPQQGVPSHYQYGGAAGATTPSPAGGGGRIGAWQPAAPTSSSPSLQAAMQSPPPGQPSPYGQQSHQQQRLPPGAVVPSPQQQQAQQQHSQRQPPPYGAYYNPYASPYGGWQPGAGQQPQPPPHLYPPQHHHHPGMRGGGTYYPPPPAHMMAAAAAAAAGGGIATSPMAGSTPPPPGSSSSAPSGATPSGGVGAGNGAARTPVFTPPGGGGGRPGGGQAATPLVQAPKPRRPLVITDKQGNVIDLTAGKKAPSPASTPATAAATPPPPSSAASAAAGVTPTASTPKPADGAAAAAATPSAPSAGDKLRLAALARIEGDQKKLEEQAAAAAAAAAAKKEAEDKARKEAEDKARKEAEEEARLEAEAAAKKAEEEAAEKKRQEEEEQAAKKLASEMEKLRLEEEAAAAAAAAKKPQEAEQAKASPPMPASSLAAAAAAAAPPRRSLAAASAPSGGGSGSRIVYSKDALLRFRTRELIRDRPESLPDMTIVRGPSRGKSGGDRGGGGGGGGRQGSVGGGSGGPPRRQSSTGDRQQQQRDGGGGGEWSRGQAQPKQPKGGRQRSGRGAPMFYDDGPVEPLVKSANHWKPKKSDNALIVAEKQVKSILNKMTKEKFDRLSGQMLDIRIESLAILTMMINNVFDKAIDEPSFGDMYADLCVRLSKSAQIADFVHVIESDEEPPTEDGGAPISGESSSYSVYRWSNNVTTSDSDVVGPFSSVDECYDAALSEEDEFPPGPRGETELELVSVSIKRTIFVKIMKKKKPAADEDKIFYVVYFPVAEASECGQQLSEIFLSEVECRSDATKKNSFKRTLLEKCQDEFDKQDIYVDWKREKAEYAEKKSTMTEAEKAEREEYFELERFKIKKQMLGNVKFIGQLYKTGLLKEKIMRLCIAQLLKLTEIESSAKSPEYKDDGDMDLDEEDHEAICSIFTTIGSTIDVPAAANFMKVCFTKIKAMSVHKSLPSRSRFMYKDLIELRANSWVPRRKVENAKTLDEIRKEVEREERRQAQQAPPPRSGPHSGGPAGGRGGDFRQSRSGRGDSGRGDNRSSLSASARQRQTRPETDDDGFTTISSSRTFTPKATPTKILQPSKSGASASSLQRFAALDEDHATTPVVASKEPLSNEQLARRIKSMRSDFIADGGNVGDLLLSMDEVLASNPGAGTEVVVKSVDGVIEGNDKERTATLRVLGILFEKGRLTKSDAEKGLADTIEFIDSMILDAPRAFEHLALVLAELLRVKAISLRWICEELEKTKSDPKTKAPEEVLRHLLEALKKSIDRGAVDAHISSSQGALEKLVGTDKWRSIYNAI